MKENKKPPMDENRCCAFEKITGLDKKKIKNAKKMPNKENFGQRRLSSYPPRESEINAGEKIPKVRQ